MYGMSVLVLAGDFLTGKEMKEPEFIGKIPPVAPSTGERVSSVLGRRPGCLVRGQLCKPVAGCLGPKAACFPNPACRPCAGFLLYQGLLPVIFITLVYLWGPRWEVIFQAC